MQNAQYEDETLQAMALSVIPEDDLQTAAADAIAASSAAGDVPVLAQQDALARQLLLWFKRDFFSWVCLAARITLSLSWESMASTRLGMGSSCC